MNSLSAINLAAAALLLAACSCGKPEGNADATKDLEVFNPKIADAAFAAESTKGKWEYTLDMLERHRSNPKDIAAWLQGKTSDLFSNKQSVPINTLRKINEILYEREPSMAASQFAQFTLANFNAGEHANTHAIAAATLSNYYQIVMNKDSIAKYNDILESFVGFDTSRWLQLIYFTNQANLSTLEGSMFQATVNYARAIELTDPRDSMSLGTLFVNLARVYADMEYFDKARMYADSALAVMDMGLMSLQTLNAIGIIHSRSHDFEKAELVFATAFRKAVESHTPAFLAQCQANYGNHKRRRKDYPEALRLMASSDSICGALGIGFGIVVNRINRAEVYYDQGDFARAALELERSEDDIQQMGDLRLEMEFYRLYFRIQDALKNDLLANRYFRKYSAKKEEYLGDLPRSVIAEWELSVEREKNTARNAAYELELETQSKQKYFIAFVLCLLLFFLSLVYFMRDRRHVLARENLKQEKQKMAYELEIKSKELLSDSLKNASIENIKEWVREELDEILKELPREHKARFSKLTGKLKADNRLANIEEFEARFTGVYEDFYDKLRAIAPDLTPNELRLCALLRLNISTKEMATLTNRSVGTVENLRISIRKKMHLESQENLQQVLINL